MSTSLPISYIHLLLKVRLLLIFKEGFHLLALRLLNTVRPDGPLKGLTDRVVGAGTPSHPFLILCRWKFMSPTSYLKPE